MSGPKLTIMIIEMKMAPQESASAGDRIFGKSAEEPAATSVVILRRVSAKTCCEICQ